MYIICKCKIRLICKHKKQGSVFPKTDTNLICIKTLRNLDRPPPTTSEQNTSYEGDAQTIFYDTLKTQLSSFSLSYLCDYVIK